MLQFLSECLVVGSNLWIAAQDRVERLDGESARPMSLTRAPAAINPDTSAIFTDVE